MGYATKFPSDYNCAFETQIYFDFCSKFHRCQREELGIAPRGTEIMGGKRKIKTKTQNVVWSYCIDFPMSQFFPDLILNLGFIMYGMKSLTSPPLD